MSTAPGHRQILMTADAVGGVWQYALDLATQLCRRGDTVTLAVLGPRLTTQQRHQAEQIGRLRLAETAEALDWLVEGPEPVEQAALAIARLAREIGADIIHCNSPALAGAADYPAPVIAAAHGCVSTWWQAVRGTPLDPAFGWHREMTRRGLLAADAVIVPSAAYASQVQATYQLAAAPMVVHNGRRALPLPPPGDRPLDAALTAARLWDEAKGTAVLDWAAGLIRAPILAAGALRGPHGETAAPVNLEALGSLDETALGALLAQRPVFVSAATFEPFGLAVLEAAQAGCALVLSDIATFRELWDGAALFVAPGKAEGFAQEIENLIAAPERRAALGQAAMRQASRYTPEACAAAIASLYDRLLARPRVAA